ncbi:MAG: LAGLIDADG family homing endonuclease [Candidatus Nanohaloarchaea archaeon]
MPAEEDIKRIKELAREGRSVNEISESMSIPKSTVYYHFRKEVGQKQKRCSVSLPDDDETRGELCGVFAGDGNAHTDSSGHYRIRFYLNNSEEYWRKLSGFLEDVLGKEPRVYRNPDANRAVLDYYSRSLYRFLKSRLSWEEGSKTGTVCLDGPQNESFREGFLRGLIDTDGYREKKFRRYIYGTISRSLRNDFSRALSRKEIQHTCYSEKPSCSEWETMYKVRISGSMAEKFCSEINPRNPKRKNL